MRRIRTARVTTPGLPGKPTDPLGASLSFVAFSFLYATGMLWAATGAANGSPASSLAVVTGLVTAAFAASFAERYSRDEMSLDGIAPYLLAAGPPVIYVATYYAATGHIGGEPTTAVAVQATLLLLVFGTYTRPLVPRWITRLDADQKQEALDRHMRDWWGFSHLSISVILAFGIGVAAGLLRDGAAVAPEWFVQLALTTFLGVGALWWYALKKIRAVGAERKDDLVS